MARRLCLPILCVALLVLIAPPTPAAVPPQITDPALDYPNSCYILDETIRIYCRPTSSVT